MTTVTRISERVKPRGRAGRPRLRTPVKEQELIRTCVRAAIVEGQMPSDSELAGAVGLGVRTVRGVRLWAGLNRWQVAAWIRERESAQSTQPEEVELCMTPWAGVWLLVPLIIRSALSSVVQQLNWTTRTGINAWHWVLTILVGAMLGFRRFAHLDDFRHAADLGLALFTGRVRLLADSTVWRLIHTLQPESAEVVYQETAAEGVPLNAPPGEEWVSMDEHIVGFFTKLKPRPLQKTRVPTRGRSYPAIRLYAPFHLWSRRFVGLVVTKATRALSQVLPTLIAEVRRLRKRAEHLHPQQVDLILDRGAYKGALFEQLMADPDVRFLAMARGTQKNVPQWEAVPEGSFTSYQPRGEKNPNLKIAETTTVVSDCRYPLRTVLIRDDTPGTKQRWRAVFAKVSVEELTPPEVDATYRRRQDHENSFAELDHHLAGKYLPKPYRLLREANEKGQKRKTVGTTLSAETMTGLRFVAWLRHWTYNLVKDFGAALGTCYATMEVGTLVRKFIARPGILRLRGNQFLVTLMPFTGCVALTEWVRQINEQQLAIPWLGHLILQIEIASHPVGCAADPQAVRRKIFANSHSHFPA